MYNHLLEPLDDIDGKAGAVQAQGVFAIARGLNRGVEVVPAVKACVSDVEESEYSQIASISFVHKWVVDVDALSVGLW